MKLVLKRTDLTDKSTIGELFLDGEFVCYTLEDKVREDENKNVSEWKIKGETAIPRGSYKLAWTMSNRFKEYMLLLKGVPGFSGIRIHAGNWAHNTEGCILVGTGKSTDMITSSRDALRKLEALLVPLVNSMEGLTLEIEG